VDGFFNYVTFVILKAHFLYCCICDRGRFDGTTGICRGGPLHQLYIIRGSRGVSLTQLYSMYAVVVSVTKVREQDHDDAGLMEFSQWFVFAEPP